MSNLNDDSLQTIINKLPNQIFFNQLPDRKQALNYLEWLYKNVPESKTINEDKLIREVINKELRIVNMKITEIEILLMVAIDKLSITYFTLDSKSIIKQLISENKENYELDTMYKIMAQVMSKLPRDLKERVNGKHKLEIFQKIAESINIDNHLLEKFISYDPTLNSPISMELDSGDYNTLNKKYLKELKEYEESKGYINSDSMEYAQLATEQLDDETIENENSKHLTAEYIDEHPEFMLGKNNNTLYYFDSSSGALTEMPINGNHTPVSLTDLKTILMSNKVKKNEIQSLINNLKLEKQTSNSTSMPTIVSTEENATQPSNFFDTVGSYFTSFMSSEATATSSTQYSVNPNSNPNATPVQLKENNITSNNNVDNSTPLPEPPTYLKNKVNSNNTNNSSNIFSKNNIMKNFYNKQTLYETFTNQNQNQNNTKENFLDKIKNDNKNIENTAIGFISVIIIVFLLVIFNSIRNNKQN